MTPDRPVAEPKRLPLLDVLRGFALFGIFFVNLTWFSGWAVLGSAQRAALPTAAADGAADLAIQVLVDGKFYSLFALLFGAGFALQRMRARARGLAFAPAFTRRMLVLLAIGTLHATLLWFGDILSLYAVTGLALLLFLGARAPSFRAALALLALPAILYPMWFVLPAGAPGHGPPELLPAFGNSAYGEMLNANAAFLQERWWLAVFTGRFFKLLGMFLLGAWAAERGLFATLPEQRTLLRRVCAAGMLFGLPANLALALLGEHVGLRPPSMAGWLVATLYAFGVPALCLGYAAGIALFVQRAPAAWILAPLRAAGRMSLTHYLSQTVVGVAVFYGCGLGLWGSLGGSAVLVVALAVFGVQALLASAWMQWFRQGPIEWVWRCASMGRWLPLRRATAAGTTLPAADEAASASAR